ILTVTEMDYGKRTSVSAYRLTGRGGKGVITIKTTGKNGRVVGAFQVTVDMQIILITTHGGKIIRLKASEISIYGRGTQGLRLIDLEPGEKVAAIAKVPPEDKSIDME
ncbi:MAG: DNA gyrase C-terminal beta-propeller domain-containing protein, partial [Thermodesulfobacteriota bacterium]